MLTNIVDFRAIQALKQSAGLIQDMGVGAAEFLDQLSTVNLMALTPELLRQAVESMVKYKILHQLTQNSLRSHIDQQAKLKGRLLSSEEVIDIISINSPDTLRVFMK